MHHRIAELCCWISTSPCGKTGTKLDQRSAIKKSESWVMHITSSIIFCRFYHQLFLVHATKLCLAPVFLNNPVVPLALQIKQFQLFTVLMARHEHFRMAGNLWKVKDMCHKSWGIHVIPIFQNDLNIFPFPSYQYLICILGREPYSDTGQPHSMVTFSWKQHKL